MRSDFGRLHELIVSLENALTEDNHGGLSLIKYSQIIDELHKFGDQAIFQANFSHHLTSYGSLLASYSAEGHNPVITELILNSAGKVIQLCGFDENSPVGVQAARLRKEAGHLSDALNGAGHHITDHEKTISFPIAEDNGRGETLPHLVTISVRVIPGGKETKFIIHPTDKSHDKMFREQVQDSFDNALLLLKQYCDIKTENFEVYLRFSSGHGKYEGDSFGAALSLAFMFSLSGIYNQRMIISAASDMIIAGGVKKSGEIKPVGEYYAKLKTEAAFYSSSAYFLIAAEDEKYAREKLEELLKLYPLRKMKILGIEDTQEIISRRYLISITNKPVARRFKEYIRKNYVAALLMMLLFLTAGLYLAYRADTNPIDYEFGERIVKVKNKFGNVLWTVKSEEVNPLRMKFLFHALLLVRIIDADSDGKNEVIVSGVPVNNKDGMIKNSLVCFKGEDEILWSYYPEETLSSVKEPDIPAEYAIKIIDTVTISGRKLLYVMFNNIPTFPGGIQALDLRTGERVGGTLWSAGHIYQAGIFDHDRDGNKELMIARADNGLKHKFLNKIDLPVQSGQLRSSPQYRLLNVDYYDPPLAIQTPESGYPTALPTSGDMLMTMLLINNSEPDLITFHLQHKQELAWAGYDIKLHRDLVTTTITIWGQFAYDRDSLINAGKLSPPYTDTPEFIDFLQKQIKVWKNGVRVR